MFDEAAVLASLSPPLKREVMAACAQELKDKVPWIRDDPVLHARVSSIAEPQLAVDGDVLIREGEIGHTVFIISQGVVELFRTPHSQSFFAELVNKSEPKFIKAISDGCTFGAIGVVLGVRCSATAIAKGNVMLYAISKKDFTQLLKEFEVTQQYFLELAALRKKRIEEHSVKNNNDMEDEGDETIYVDPEDAKTELFQLSMQLADQDHDVKRFVSSSSR